MKNKRNIIGIIVLLLLIGGIIMSDKIAAKSPLDVLDDSSVSTSSENEKAPAEATLAPQLDSPLLTNAPLASDFVMGKDNAPVTLIEYASMSCPHCAHFHNDVLPALTEKYIATGKLRYILRQFPLNESAFAGAMLVTCMGDKGGPGRYYTFARVLFDSQKKWAFDEDFKASLKTFAEVGGVDGKTFDSCLSDTALEKKILQGRKDASEQLQIDSTPYVFLNGHPYKGGKNISAVSAEIETLLRKK